MKRKIIPFLLVLCLLLALMPGAGLADGDELQLAMVGPSGDSMPQSFHYSAGVGHMINFYLGADDILGTKLAVTSAVSSDTDIMTIRENGDGTWMISFLAPGTATLTVTTAGGDSYTKAITLSLPEYAFYADAAGGEVNYVSSAQYAEGLKLWLLKYDGKDFTPVEGATYTPDVTANGDGSITPADPGNNGYSLQAAIDNGGWMTNVFLRISPASVSPQPGEEGLQLAMVDPFGGDDSSLKSFHYSVGVGHMIYFYFGAGDVLGTKLAVTSAVSSDTNVMTIRENGDGTWMISFLAPGTATLTVTTAGGDSYTKAITLSLPEYAFYTAAAGGAEAYCSSVQYAEGLKLWLLQYDGKDFTTVEGATYTPDVTLNGDGSITPADPGSEGYSLQAEITNTFGTRNVFLWISPASTGPVGPQLGEECHIETFGPEEARHAVGFGFERTDDVLDLYDEHMSGPVNPYVLEPGPGSYGRNDRDRFDYQLYTAEVIGQEGVNTIYRKANLAFTVKSLILEPTDGDADTFSLEPGTTQVTVAATPSAAGSVYYDRAHAGAAKLTAVVEIGGTEYTVWVTFTCREITTRTIDCSDLDTIQAVNERLAGQSKGLEKIEIVFGAHAYTAGTDGVTVITIPNLTDLRDPNAITVHGTEENGTRTAVLGGIVYASDKGGMFTGIDFTSPTEGEGTALAGTVGAGACNVFHCSFTGYATGIDCTKSFIGATEGNTFTNNTVAVHVSLTDGNCNQDQWRFNRFLRNGTALKVDQLNNFITPYYFRLRDSDFMCNTVDFDISPVGNYYFYRNYFYCVADNGLRPPQFAEGSVEPHCYPSRAYSITEDNDTLIYGEENTVLNSLADELLVAEVADGTTIRVVEDDGLSSTLLATWSFDHEGGND